MSPTVETFSDGFIAQYADAFDELLRLVSLASQNKVAGKESKSEDETAQKIINILRALNSPDLTAKEIEALEYCLIVLNKSLAVPTVDAVVIGLAPYVSIDDLTFQIGDGVDVVDSFGDGTDVESSIGS